MTQFVGSGPAPTAQQQAPPVEQQQQQREQYLQQQQQQQQQQKQQEEQYLQQQQHQQQVLQQQQKREEEQKIQEKEQPPEEKEENPSANITPSAQPSLRGKKARVEFRDQNGNVLDEALVAQLQQEGKVSIESRFEYRSRLSNGHEVDVVDGKVAPAFPDAPAPAHPDVDGQNPETMERQKPWPAEDGPAPAAAGDESSLGQESSSPQPEPASEGHEATD